MKTIKSTFYALQLRNLGMVDILVFLTRLDIPGQWANRKTPVEILRIRFARGETMKEEFDDMKKQIEKN